MNKRMTGLDYNDTVINAFKQLSHLILPRVKSVSCSLVSIVS